MRIAHVTTTPSHGGVDELVARHPILERFPAAQAAAGHEVALLCRSDRDSLQTGGGLRRESVAGARLEACLRLRERAAAFAPEVFHLHGVTANSALMAGLLRSRFPEAVITIQDQAFHWPTSIWGRLLLRAGLPAANRVFFAARAQAQTLVHAGALRDSQVVELPGGSSELEAVPQPEARRRMGLKGRPLYLWVGRLAPVKDPLAAARAMKRVLRANPEARLAMAYGTDELLGGVRATLAEVGEQVTLLGRVTRAVLPDLYSSADIYLSTSVREGYSYALVEALACGVSPVVSAIPASLKAIGALGGSFPQANEDALVQALEAPPSPRREVREHFDQHLSFTAMARLSLEEYACAQRAQAPSRPL
jgi:glycosyltransferase involved in cell wall biosynthesis